MGVFGLALAVLFAFHPLSRPLVRDAATWDYMSVEIARGLVVYRDVFLHKTPLGALLGALGAAAAPWVGLTPVAGAHLLFLVFGAAGPALLCMLCRKRSPVHVAVTVGLLLIAYDQWLLAALEGARPKIVTTLFGIACLIAAGNARPLLAGLLGAASVLCWQPGLCFVAGAAVAIVRTHGRRAPARLAWMAVGASLPVVALLAWLWMHGALADFLAQAVVFNVDYIELRALPPWQTAAKLASMLWRWDRPEVLALPFALAGLWRARWRMPAGVAVSGLVYLAMVFASFQSWPDTILLGPMIACATGIGLHALVARLGGGRVPALALVALAAGLACTPSTPRVRPPVTFDDQAAFVARVVGPLKPEDRIVAISAPAVLVHLDRRSAWRWPYMWSGVDRFAAAHTPGGEQGVIDELTRIDPAVIVVARRWQGPLRQRFERWAAARYSRTRHYFYPDATPVVVYRRLGSAASSHTQAVGSRGSRTGP